MQIKDGRERVVITHVQPVVEEGLLPVKGILGDDLVVTADIFTDGHSEIAGSLVFRKEGQNHWEERQMESIDADHWQARFSLESLGTYFFTIRAWLDHFRSWQNDLSKKFLSGIDITNELWFGVKFIKQALDKKNDATLSEAYLALLNVTSSQEAYKLATSSELSNLMKQQSAGKGPISHYKKILSVSVEPPLARFSSWYEFFPRSTSPTNERQGTLQDCILWLPEISKMGFDVLYLPPIHPIGHSFRKGKNNRLTATDKDPGSPWAIGSEAGGHMSIDPLLGTEKDFEELVKTASKYKLHIALDLAFQCSPDHPYITAHPDWFLHRPDGSIQHAENPPKKYEDIVPFYFETVQWKSLWEELKQIVLFWCEKGIHIFRADNPHTKPFAFWQWLIAEVKNEYPETIFLSEAFTRPAVMHWLAKIGFSQSYTYFTWRYTKHEIMKHMLEITNKETLNYFRPNLWPNTPDILPFDLQYDGQATFMTRLILAATLSSNYGVYGPPYEAMLNLPLGQSEEYAHAEKYEIKWWDRKERTQISELMTKINSIRKNQPALQKIDNIKFYENPNRHILCYFKDDLLIAVSLDPFTIQSTTVHIPLEALGIPPHTSYSAHELLQDRHYLWEDAEIEITIDPKNIPAQIYKIESLKRREKNFEYFI